MIYSVNQSQIRRRITRCALTEADTDRYQGKVLENRFEVLSPLDKGGMGSVYKGRDNHRQIDIAVKFLLEKEAKQDDTVKRFKQEALLLNDLNHDNVVHVYAFGWHPELGAYLILEYVHGQSVASYIEKCGPFEIREAIDLLIQICEGLSHAHECGVLHRDLKPANFMLVENEDEAGRTHIKILDFGISRRLEPEKALALTQQGHVFGSPLYMSPEQCQGQQLDERGDIYSLGCVAYEMLTGAPPLIADTWLATVIKHVTELPPPLSTYISDVPPGLEEVVMKCLSKKKEDRYQSVAELRTELLKFHPSGINA